MSARGKGFGGRMVIVRRVLSGFAASALAIGLLSVMPSAQAACGDYGEPPCPTQTATPPPPPPPPPSPSPVVTVTVTPTASVTPTPIPIFTIETNPQAATVVGSGVILVSQETAERVTPRLVLRPLASTLKRAQVVRVVRMSAQRIITQFLRPNVSYDTEIRIKGKWLELGTTRANARGQMPLPVIRTTSVGDYPMRVIPTTGTRKALYLRLLVQNKR